MSIAIPRGLRSIPARRRPSCVRQRRLMASRFTGRAKLPAPIPSRNAVQSYFDPYHAALAGEIARLRSRHSQIVLYDCHSIRSVIPRLFEGTLPNFNIGTNAGRSCAPQLTAAVEKACRRRAIQYGRERPFQGRLDHTVFRRARSRRSRHPDGIVVPRLYARNAWAGVRARLADAVGRELRFAYSETSSRGAGSVPRIRPPDRMRVR